MKKAVIFVGLALLTGLVQAQDVYKLRVSDWSCALNSSGAMVAKGMVVNQSGQTLNNV